MTSIRQKIPAFVVCWSIAVTLTPAAAADSLVDTGAVLPFDRSGAAVAVGSELVFVEDTCGLGVKTHIARYDTVTNVTTLETAKVPVPLTDYAAASDGQSLYLFGGRHDCTSTAGSPLIWRYDLTTRRIEPAGFLPAPRERGTTAVWTGQSFYVLGGGIPDVVLYDPITRVTIPLPVDLPAGNLAGDAFFVEPYIYVPMRINDPLINDAIVRVNIDTFAVDRVLDIRQIFDPLDTTTAWTGTYAYFFGGCCNANHIYRYDPASNEFLQMGQTTPVPPWGLQAAWDGDEIWLVQQTVWKYVP